MSLLLLAVAAGVSTAASVFMVYLVFDKSADTEFWRDKALALIERQAAQDKLSDLIARHRIDLDDEALWAGYTEWLKTQE
jgi:hypothetical protein